MATLVRRLTALLASTACAGVVLAAVGTVTTADPATAAATAATASARAQTLVGRLRPVAIAVDADGTSYVGYTSGDRLSVISAAGRLRPAIRLADDAPVLGIALAGGQLWVDQGRTISVLGLGGRLLRSFPTGAGDCAVDATHQPGAFGGIAVGSDRVFTTDRCDGYLRVYDRSSGDPVHRVRLPGGSRGRGLAVDGGSGRSGARLFVAQPARAVVLTYAVGRLKAGARPSHSLRVRSPGRGHRPVPTGIVVDRFGDLGVADAGNQAVYLYNSRRGYARYRVLGHPSRARSYVGFLSRPAALAQYRQDGSGLSGNLFLADTGNGRVQRWDSGNGATKWLRALRVPGSGGGSGGSDGGSDGGSGGGSGGVVTRRPAISRPDAGTLYCNPGRWTFDPAAFSYRWLRDGVLVTGASGSRLPIDASAGGSADGHEFVCRVTATATGGRSATADSEPYFIGTAAKPANTAAPRIVGSPQVGQDLGCDTGTWTGTPAPRFAYQWLRGGVPVAQTPDYLVGDDDRGAQLTCTVTASNRAGSTAASSPPVSVS